VLVETAVIPHLMRYLFGHSGKYGDATIKCGMTETVKNKSQIRQKLENYINLKIVKK